MIQFTILIETSVLISINDMFRYVNDIIETIIDPELNEIEHHYFTIRYIIVKYC